MRKIEKNKIAFPLFIGLVLVLCWGIFLNADEKKKTETSHLDDGLIAHWSFSEGSGDVVLDSAGSDINGNLFGPKWTKGVAPSNHALEFDGIDDYVQIDPKDKFLNLGKGSISVWFKLDRLPQDKEIFPIFYYGTIDPCTNMFDAANEGLIIEVGHHPVQWRSLRLYFTIWSNGCSYPSFCYDSNFAMEPGEWHHFVAVVGDDYNTGYFDGEELTKRRYNFGNSRYSEFFEDAVDPSTIWIGRGYWDAEPDFFDGLIDDIRVYDKPLDADSVKELYEFGKKDHSKDLSMDLNINPDRAKFASGDELEVLFNIDTPAIPILTDIYFVMLNVDRDMFYFANTWGASPSPLLERISLPTNFSLRDVPLLTLDFPSMRPPVNGSGHYIFALGATAPDTLDLISPDSLATAGFVFE